MDKLQTTFALCFGSRGFFPHSLIEAARTEITNIVEAEGYHTLVMPANETPTGAVETFADACKFARFLKANEGKFDGVILALPNFGDEKAAKRALRDAGVPILIMAYPDEMDKMDPENRRDGFCGKLSIQDVFSQVGILFSAYRPHVINPNTDGFKLQLERFAAVCRVANGLRRMTVGAIGARTTAFETVRFDELTLERNGITVVPLDMSEIFHRMDATDFGDDFGERKQILSAYADFSRVPNEEPLNNLTRMSLVLDEIIAEHELNALSLRCWTEPQKYKGISPCTILSMLNNMGFPAACEVDTNNAVAMYALMLACNSPASCLDWNNNYGDDEDKCILFHCGPVPAEMMTARGIITDHDILKHDVNIGPGNGYGCNTGRIAAGPFAFASLTQRDGGMKWYAGDGIFTGDPIPPEYFGCAGVAEIPNLQTVLDYVGRYQHRHHVSTAMGLDVAKVLFEAIGYYRQQSIALPQQMQRSILS